MFFVVGAQSYNIAKAPFSSDRYDEFSPVFFKSGIVFCSNRNTSSFINYSGINNKGQLKIFYIDTTSKVKWSRSKLFSKDLTSRLNDGPASFNSKGDTIYFSRNMRVDGKLSEIKGWGNNLGIFLAVSDGMKWNKASEFRFNNELYNFTTPFLSPDGTKLFFASDRSGGFGGSDIYYSQWRNGYWGDPVNLGALINTKGNESYPFLNEAGEFFFSSDGHDGLGGKDIYVTKQNATGWYPPVMLDAPVNSKYDDFGIVTDPLMREGYFSSNRDKSIDIFRFKSNSFQFWFSEPQKDNNYCVTISDTGSIGVDTLKLKYVWSFNDSSIVNGPMESFCFPGPGKYIINLDLFDKKTGKLFFNKLKYDIEIFNIDQPYINSPNAVLTGDSVELNGLKSYCQGNKIDGYLWDFGDGMTGNGESLKHIYTKQGEYNIKMGLILKSLVTGTRSIRIVSKKITVLNSAQERSLFMAAENEMNQRISDIKQIGNIKINSFYSAENDFIKESLFQVVLLSSSGKVELTSTNFKNVASKYGIKEIFDANEGKYYYVVDQQMNLMATYPIYSEMIASGFKDAMVRLCLLQDPAEKELYNIRKNYSLLTDANIDFNNRLTTNAYIMLDQVVNMMNKNPAINLEIGVHTDNQGNPPYNLSLSQFRAQIFVNYLTSRGISGKRLIAKGYGSSRPVASNLYPTERRLNRRIDFVIVNK